jgi:hypothetical protein
MLDLAKALSFFASILSLYWVTVSAFFIPGARWEERLILALSKLALAACISFASGLLFCWPSPSNPTRGQALTSTLPVRLFFWSTAGIAVLFATSWYLLCRAPIYGNIYPACR